MVERVHHYIEHARIKAGLVVTAGALALGLGGCTSGETPETAALEAVPSVEADAAALTPYDQLFANELTNEIAAQPDADKRYENLSHSDPATGEEIIGDFPLTASAPLLTITLDEKSKELTYKDSTPGLSTDESKLLGTVAASAPLLEAAMETGRLDSFRFRIMEPSDPLSTYTPTEEMFFLPKDYSGKGKDESEKAKAEANIYYFLPASGTLDLEAMTAMNRHEGLHAALEHTPEMNLDDEQQTRYQQACNTLRTAALQEMRAMGSTSKNALYQLGLQAPAELHPAYETVINAIEDGTYGKLPSFLDDDGTTIKECYVQPPYTAVLKQAELMGLGHLMDPEHDDEAKMDLIAIVQDDWNDSIEDLTIYKILKEAHWLAADASNKGKGHPQDGWHEVAASSYNRLLGDPENFALEVKYLSPELQDAITMLLDISEGQLQQKYGHHKDTQQLIKQQRAIFDKELSY